MSPRDEFAATPELIRPEAGRYPCGNVIETQAACDDMVTALQTQIVCVTGHRLGIAVALAIGSLAAGSIRAQESGTVTVDVERCLALETESERRECFATQVNEVLEDQAPTATATTSRQRPAAAPESESRAPATGQRAAAPEAAAAVASSARAGVEESDPEEFFGTIVSMRERIPNAYVITLDNGQIWEQTEPKRYPLRPGLEVRIYPTRWGNRYRLAGLDSGGHIQVQRLR
jgi:hypothetical protein